MAIAFLILGRTILRNQVEIAIGIDCIRLY